MEHDRIGMEEASDSVAGELANHRIAARLGERLNRLSRDGKWQEMAAAVPDEVVHAFAAVGRYDEIVPRIRERFHGIRRIAFPAPAEDARDEGLVRELLQELTNTG